MALNELRECSRTWPWNGFQKQNHCRKSFALPEWAAVTSFEKTVEVHSERDCWSKGNEIERNNRMELERKGEYNIMEPTIESSKQKEIRIAFTTLIFMLCLEPFIALILKCFLFSCGNGCRLPSDAVCSMRNSRTGQKEIQPIRLPYLGHLIKVNQSESKNLEFFSAHRNFPLLIRFWSCDVNTLIWLVGFSEAIKTALFLLWSSSANRKI